MKLRTQQETDWSDPKQHFAWALRNLPMVAGVGGVSHPTLLFQWSEHLFNCGFAHRDYLESLADEDGNIHVSKLPVQVTQFQPAARGPRNAYNNAARWVAAGTPDPEPVRIPDIRELTANENAAMIQQYMDAGLIPSPDPKPEYVLAEEVYE